MEASNVASRGIVHELLTKDNYKRWKTLVKNYLLGKNLWAVVENGAVVKSGADSSEKDDQRKNAEALHIIQLSCGSKIFDEISDFEKAKDAWNHLRSRYSSELKAQLDIEKGVVEDNVLRDLYAYVEKGNSKATKSFIKGNKGALFLKSDSSGRTVLHVATMAGHVNIVEMLVIEGSDKLVNTQDERGYTALALAAHHTGNADVAKCMVELKKDKVREDLLGIPIENDADTSIEIPLLLAADKGHKEMTRYLYRKTPAKLLTQNSRTRLLERCIKAEIFDVALRLLDSYEKQPPEPLPLGFITALLDLAQMPSAFFSGCQLRIPQKIIYHILTLRAEKKFQNSVGDEEHDKTNYSGRFCRSVLNFLQLPLKLLGRFCRSVWNFLQLPVKLLGIREIYEQKRTHSQVRQILKHLQRRIAEFNNSKLDQASVYDAMLHAAEHGIVEFIDAMTEANGDLLWVMDSRKRGILSHAILCRKQKVFQLIHTLKGSKDLLKSHKDVFGNNLLHLAGHLGPSSDLYDRPGAALQMQREMQWFKAVEKVVHPKCKEEKNDDDKKPHQLFTETHKELVKDGEKWAKGTAKSFTVVGTLITTIMFAAAFTIPGGNHEDTGVPIFLNSKILTTFLVADAISLFTSATSVLIFLGILTSHFGEKDFLKILPWKLLFGLVFLFLSVVSMMVAFCAALAIVLKQYPDYRWLIRGAIIFGSIPVMVLVVSQLSLMYEIIRSTISNPIGYTKKKKQ